MRDAVDLMVMVLDGAGRLGHAVNPERCDGNSGKFPRFCVMGGTIGLERGCAELMDKRFALLVGIAVMRPPM